MYKNYKKRKKYNFKKIGLISFLVVAFIIGIIVNIVYPDRKLTIFEKAIKDSVFFVQKVVSYPIDFVVDKRKVAKEKNEIYKNFEELNQRLLNCDQIKNENEELKIQIDSLKNLLDLNNVLSEYDVVNAMVISRDLNYWNETIVIDKGENSNIKIGDQVVVNEGLIGKVIKTSNMTSTIRLLIANNINDKFSVKIVIDGISYYGILTSYNVKKNTYIIEGIPQNVKIDNGTLVTTTGMGDNFPSGIVVGKVVLIDTDNFDLSKILEVEPLVNFDNINYVSVLKRSDKS